MFTPLEVSVHLCALVATLVAIRGYLLGIAVLYFVGKHATVRQSTSAAYFFFYCLQSSI